jgi:hypothetical protein
MERPLSSSELMDMLAKREQKDMTPAERKDVRNMPLPVSKPSAKEIAAMKEAGRQEFKNNKQRVITHLKKKGLSNAAIAGIVGNIEVETGGSFDFTQKQTKTGDPRSPEIVEGGGYGLFQFDDPRNKEGHETWYKQYLKQTKKKDSTESQLDYFLDMIMAGENKDDPFYKYASNMGAGNAGVIKAYLETNKNPSQISDAITDRFEKASIKHSDRRRAAAQSTFEELQPRDRPDIDPEEQNINQAAPIADVGEDVESPEKEKSFLDYVPVVRQFRKSGFFAEGGNVTMDRQMELFDDGGLMDEGGTVDPESGNEVPVGSMQEEVRDDIPAQLSEGEFVFPADVVRYIGLGNLMQMRQEAKMGLKLMDQMGQMGNSDEATIPDDLPFDINDLDMEDEPEYNVGGFVPGTQQQQQFGISGFQQAATPTTGVAQAPVQAASQQFVQPMIRPQQAAVPTMKQYKPAEIPTFQQTIGQTPGQYDELREYKNEAGMTMQIPFKNGQPIYPIPEGYKFVDPEKTKTEEVTTTPTTPQTTSVRDTSDSDERRRKEEEKTYGPGGGRLGVDGTIYGVSFDMGGEGLDKLKGIGSIVTGLLGSGTIPAGATATIKRGNVEFTVGADDYNALKQTIKDFGANSKEAKQKLDDIGLQAAQDRQNEIKQARAAADQFSKEFKAAGYVLDKETGAFVAKPGASKAEKDAAQKMVDDYVAKMLEQQGKSMDEDDAADDILAAAQAKAAASRPAYADILSEKETRRASERAAVAKERRDAEIRREAEALRQADAAAARKAAAVQRSERENQPDDTVTRTAPTSNDENRGGPRGRGGGRSRSGMSSSRGSFGSKDSTGGSRRFDEGGLVKKKHSKTPEQQAAIAIAKKARGKKRGGLASKK